MVSSSNWAILPIGGGGFVTGVARSSTDMVCRTDTNGAFRWGSSSWVQLFTATSLAACPDLISPNTQTNVTEIQVARTASATMYALYQGWLIKSINAGATWSHCPGWTTALVDDGTYRYWACKIAIDPVNADVVFVGTNANGLFLTVDGGANFTAIPSVPVSVPLPGTTHLAGISGIVFVPANSGQSSTGPSGILQTGTVYVASGGNGVYMTAAAWDLVPTFTLSSPAGVLGAISSSTASIPWTTTNNDTYFADQAGHLWHVTNPSGTVIWTQNTAIIPYATLPGIGGIAVDPFNVLHLVGMCGSGRMCESIDQGVTWRSYNPTWSAGATEPGWLTRGGGGTGATNMGFGGMVFDSSVANKLYGTGGVGFWWTTTPNCVPPNGTPLPWNCQTHGIENLVGLKVIIPPGGRPVTASEDYNTHYSPSDTTYPAINGTLNAAFCPASTVNFAPTNPMFVARCAYPWYGIGSDSSGYSNDGGYSWTNFSTLGAIPSNVHLSGAGAIAVSTPLSMIWSPGTTSPVTAGTGQPSYTTDGGAHWTLITITGVSGWEHMTAGSNCGESITADPNNPLTYYFNVNNSMTGSGLYKTTDGGMTWTSIYGPITANQNVANSAIRVVPGHPTDLFYHDDGSAHSINAALRLWNSTNSGLSWAQVPSVVCPTHIGFGKAAPGGSGYPAIYMTGFIAGTPPVYGIWESDDAGATWGNVGTFPTGNMVDISCITGSMDTYGRAICATTFPGGAGFFLKFP